MLCRLLQTLNSMVGHVYRDIGRQTPPPSSQTKENQLHSTGLTCHKRPECLLLNWQSREIDVVQEGLFTLIIWAIRGDRTKNHGAHLVAFS